MSTTKRTRTSAMVLILLIAAFTFGCKKDGATTYSMQGKVTDGRDGQAIAGAKVTLAQQVLTNGVYNVSYTTAASANTDAAGQYSMNWERENANGIKITAELESYIKRTVYFNPTSLVAGGTNNQDIQMYPESFITVHVLNNAPNSTADYYNFRWENAEFDCTCCNLEPKVFSGVIDTTFTCRLYGDTWLKYRIGVATAELDSTINDSIFVPAFQTVNLDLTY